MRNKETRKAAIEEENRNGWLGETPLDSLRQGMLRSSNGCTKVGEVTERCLAGDR